jgi:hypothetical protein
MLVNWSSASTWNSMATSGPGIQFDNVEARSTPDATISPLNSATQSFTGAGLAATVQSWANGAPNYGWVLWQNNASTWYAGNANQWTVPVHYTALLDSPLAGAGVTVAVIDSGLLQDGGGTTRVSVGLAAASDPPSVRLLPLRGIRTVS